MCTLFLYRNQEVSFEAGCSKVVLRVVFFRKAVQKTSPNLQEVKEFTYTRVVFNKFVGCMRIFFIKSVTYPEIFGGYRLCPKSIVFFFFSFTRIPQMMGTEGPKMFEFNTSTVLEKALKALPSHFKFEQTFVFLLFIFFLAPIPHPRYQNLAGYIASSLHLH